MHKLSCYKLFTHKLPSGHLGNLGAHLKEKRAFAQRHVRMQSAGWVVVAAVLFARNLSRWTRFPLLLRPLESVPGAGGGGHSAQPLRPHPTPTMLHCHNSWRAQLSHQWVLSPENTKGNLTYLLTWELAASFLSSS